MRKLFFFLSVLFFVNISQAQKDEEMQQWLTKNISAINLQESKGAQNRDGYKSIEFTKFGITATGVYVSKADYVGRRTFESATIEDDFLILKDRMGDYYVKLKIADAAIRQRYKDIFTRYAYTFLNTGEEDFPIYEKEKVDKEAVVSEEPDGWKNFLLERFQIDAAYKHKLTPGDYKGEIQFVVTQDGKIKDFKKIGNNPKGVHETMLWLMTGARKPWIPAKLNGKNVSSFVKIKITFNVRELDMEDDNDRMAFMSYQKYKDVNLNIDDYENKNGGRRSVPPIVVTEKSKTQVNTELKKEENEITKKDVEKLEKWITEPVAYFPIMGPFKEGLASVSKQNSAGYYKCGYINTDGKIVVPLKYDEAQDFSNGLACVSLNGKSGFINRNGKVVVPLIWDAADSFSEGLAVVEINDKSGCIDITGKIVLAPKFANLHQFSEGLIAYEDNNGKWGFIDRTGKVIIEPKYGGIWGPFGTFIDGLCLMNVWNSAFKYGFIRKNGEEAIGFMYDEAKQFSEGLAAVRKEKKYGYINKEGETVIPFDYDYAYSFENGIAQVKQNERYGFINKKGEDVTPIHYLGIISSFKEGVAIVRNENRKYGFINEAGKEIVTPKYDEAGSAKHGLICVALNGSWGYIDVEGNTIIPMIYEKAYDFIGGLATVKLEGKFFLIDRAGKKWIAPKK